MWFRAYRRYARRAANFIDQAVAFAPPVVMPNERVPGLWNIPGSMLLMHRRGLRRLISSAAQISKAKAGLRRAVEQGGVFHLWTHPFNLTIERASMLRVLAEILAEAARLRKEGALEIRTMASLAEHLSSSVTRNPHNPSDRPCETARAVQQS